MTFILGSKENRLPSERSITVSGPPNMLLATCKWVGTLSESPPVCSHRGQLAHCCVTLGNSLTYLYDSIYLRGWCEKQMSSDTMESMPGAQVEDSSHTSLLS